MSSLSTLVCGFPGRSALTLTLLVSGTDTASSVRAVVEEREAWAESGPSRSDNGSSEPPFTRQETPERLNRPTKSP